jgi:cytoskeletal protein CcmA (bactofilin family)
MKKTLNFIYSKWYVLAGLVLLLLCFLVPKLVLAQDQTTVAKDETRTGIQIITANIAGTINGDTFIIGQGAVISGKIQGNLFVIASTINISEGAQINGSLFAVAQKMNLNGKVSGTTYLAGSEIDTSSTFIANQEFNFAAKSVSLDGNFKKTVNGSAQQIDLSGNYDADLLLKTTYLTYEPTLFVKGNVKYYAPYIALIKTSDTNSPTVTKDDFNKTPLPTFWQNFSQNLATKLLGLVYLLIIGFLWIWLWRDKYETVVESLKEHLWPAFGFGIIVWLLLPVAFLLLTITIIGIPLALILLGFVIFWTYLSTVLIGGFLGNFIILLLNRNETKYPYLALFLGILVLIVLYAVPVIGPILKIITAILAFGVLVIGRKKILNLKF